MTESLRSEDEDDKASVVSLRSFGMNADEKVDGFWAAHRALAAFYEADIARLEAEGQQSHSHRSISHRSHQSETTKSGIHADVAGAGLSSQEISRLRRRSSTNHHEAVASMSMTAMGLQDPFQQESEVARGVGSRMRALLEGADVRQLARGHAMVISSEDQEIKHLHQPRLVWNGSDSNLPPLHRRTSTNRITATQATEKSRGVEGRSCCNLVPDRGFRSKWDLFIMLALLIEIMFLPLQVLLDDPVLAGRHTFLQLLPPIYWSLDILISFSTGFYSTGQLVVDRWRIAKNYATRWLLFDLTYVAVDFILVMLVTSEGRYWSRELTSIAILRFLQMALRVVRVSRLGEMEALKKGMVSDVSLAKASIVQIGIQDGHGDLVLLIHHVMACGWYYLGTMSEDGWIAIAGKSEKSKLYLYTTSLHWMFCQLGFGGTEIEPNTVAERVYGLLVNFMALVIFSTLLGTVTSLAALLNRSSEERRFLFANLGRFLKYNQIDKDLGDRITHFLQHAYALKQLHVHEDQVQLFDLLSVPLCRELQLARYKKSLQEMGFLLRLTSVWRSPDENDFLIQRIASKAVSQQKFATSDLVWETETSGTEAIYLMEGALHYQLGNFEADVNQSRWMADMCLWAPWVYLGDASTKEPSGVVLVHVRQFYESIRDCNQMTVAREYAREYVDEMNRHDAVTELWHCPAGEQQPERVGSLFHYSLSAPAVTICERLCFALQRRVAFSRVVPH